jgi:hypothetical protein
MALFKWCNSNNTSSDAHLALSLHPISRSVFSTSGLTRVAVSKKITNSAVPEGEGNLPALTMSPSAGWICEATGEQPVKAANSKTKK